MKPPYCSEIPAEALETIAGQGGLDGIVSALPDDVIIARVRAFHRACADVYRVKIIEMLRVQPLCVCIIREALGISKSKLSYHLRILLETGMITGTAKGTWIVYELTEYGMFCSSVNAKIGLYPVGQGNDE
ncbi:MAG: winged helix-turn-helix transcriptional regulator [Methanomicrobiales archaeon]|jgi:ArsR family transcriptional regulator|nr:winged helix-turn-helix transcriptional regulator [Methanomicrobiales archaeon]